MLQVGLGYGETWGHCGGHNLIFMIKQIPKLILT